MTTVDPGSAQSLADRIRDRRAAEGTLGKPQPVTVEALRTLNARILAHAQAHAHEPSMWTDADEQAAHMDLDDDPGWLGDDRHEQRRVDDVLSERWSA